MRLTNRVRAEVYEGADGWRWRAIASNGRIVADSAEAYENLSHAEKMARQVLCLPRWRVRVERG